MTRRLRLVSLALGCGSLALSTMVPGADLESPFAPPPPEAAARPAAGDPLAALEFGGVVNVNGETSVYLRDSGRATGRWFRIGVTTDGVCAEQYDSGREAVCVRAGENVRWLHLPRAVVTALPVALLPDGTVDWTHMNLSEKGKETEAMHLMQDIMFVSMAAGSGAGKKSPAATASTISPVE